MKIQEAIKVEVVITRQSPSRVIQKKIFTSHGSRKLKRKFSILTSTITILPEAIIHSMVNRKSESMQIKERHRRVNGSPKNFLLSNLFCKNLKRLECLLINFFTSGLGARASCIDNTIDFCGIKNCLIFRTTIRIKTIEKNNSTRKIPARVDHTPIIGSAFPKK